MRIAGSADLVSFSEPIIIDTPQSYAAGIAALAEAAKNIAAGAIVEHIAAGLPVLLSADKCSTVNCKNIPEWCEKPFAADLEKATGGQVHLENDTALVGLGEAVYGAGKGVRTIVYITVSTGVNGARIIDGKIETDHVGVSTGRQYVSMDGPTWEDLISGRSIGEKYGKHPRDLGKDNPLWEDLARTTAYGVHNTILHWTPERVILGGSMFKDVGISVERVKFHLEKIKSGVPQLPEVVRSSLGDLGGLWGGLALFKSRS